MPGFLHNTYAVLRRELVRLTHQPMYFVLMLVLPVVSFAFFALLFNKGVARDIPIAVLDDDHTSLSRKVTQMIDANGSVGAALTGKILPVTVIMFLMSLVMFLIIFKVVGVPLNGSLTVILVSTLLFILSYQAIAVFIVSLLSNLRLSLSIGGGYSVLAFTFSGLTFPVMAMWPAMRYLSKLFPFTYYTDIFVDQMLRGAPVACSLPDMGYMSLFIVLPLLCLPRLRTICTEEKYWGRL